mmetsp:Transcript_41112/g.64290  ORF Transcript_41112/g.64290 Transcript_41112/m.64290 type:complete len:171 (-) Transcript_41112:262-774(-)
MKLLRLEMDRRPQAGSPHFLARALMTLVPSECSPAVRRPYQIQVCLFSGQHRCHIAAAVGHGPALQRAAIRQLPAMVAPRALQQFPLIAGRRQHPRGQMWREAHRILHTGWSMPQVMHNLRIAWKPISALELGVRDQQDSVRTRTLMHSSVGIKIGIALLSVRPPSTGIT